MKKMIQCAVLSGVMFVMGCEAPAGHIKAGDPALISVGMTKEQVIQKLGKPENVSADAQGETLSWVLERPWWQDKPFHVRMVSGKVVSYEVMEH